MTNEDATPARTQDIIPIYRKICKETGKDPVSVRSIRVNLAALSQLGITSRLEITVPAGSPPPSKSKEQWKQWGGRVVNHLVSSDSRNSGSGGEGRHSYPVPTSRTSHNSCLCSRSADSSEWPDQS
jgi:hypothetical protein